MDNEIDDIDCVEMENSVSHFYSNSLSISYSSLSSDLITFYANNVITTVKES